RGAVVTVFRSDGAAAAIGSRLAVIDGDQPYGNALPEQVREAMVSDARTAIASGKSCNRSYATPDGTIEAFVEAILPPPRLFVYGTGHDALPVVDLARALGWDVAVCSPHGRAATRQRFTHEAIVGPAEELAPQLARCDRAVAIVMGHHYELDKRHL